MEETDSMLAIVADLNARLAKLMLSESLGFPPRRMRKRRIDSVFIGKATKEQQALALFYDRVVSTHSRMHNSSGLPFGINPYVDSPHYRLHVLQPVLYEMLQWSVHRTFPEQKTNLVIRFDDDWNMYAAPRRQKRKTKSKST